MTSVIAQPEHLICITRPAQRHEVEIFEQIEVTRTLCEQEDYLGALVDHLVFEKRLVEKERPVQVKVPSDGSRVPLWDAIACIPRSVEDIVNAFVDHEDHNGISKTDNRM